MLRCLAILLFGLLALPALAATTGPGAYKIGGITVDTAAANPAAARDAAYREARRRGWALLWARLTGGTAGSAPRLADGAIEAMVAGVEIESERFSLTRYIGRLAIVFDRDRASAYLGGALGTQAPPMLLLPVMLDGGVRTVYQAKTPWAAAWQRYRDAASALDYVLVAPNAGDNVVLTAYQSRRSDRTLWRNILNRFKASDILTAEVKLDRSYPGGPVRALFVARHGPDSLELGRVGLRTATAAGLDAMLDDGVRAIDSIYAAALRDGRLRSEPGLIAELAPIILGGAPDIGVAALGTSGDGIAASVITPDARAWAELEALIRGTPGVTGVTLVSLSLGGTSQIIVRHAGGSDLLAYEFDRRGLRLTPFEGGVLLRRKVPGDPVVAKPPSADELRAAEPVAEPDAAPVDPVPPVDLLAPR